MIAIIDYGAGNLRSIQKALEHVGAQAVVTADPATVASARAVVLPGVGSGGAAMQRMKATGLDEAIREATARGRPFLGICLGMQLLAEHHAEGEVEGLRLFAGEVRRIPQGPKIPHMGWNQVQPLNPALPIFKGIPAGAFFYFAHSYYVEPRDPSGVAGVTDYGTPYCSVIVSDHLWGTQFHPEKSGTMGLRLLANFVRWVGEHVP
ncbi:imidazole glycerol phosphate synthase subunit HisH [Thermogemmatispora sp.]|uniref:imidazole glycerol phosphate synthase subunit HisH n=1 Tax=Thermogemmatispora sp. TaxID=1968838 RepID=UPI0035E46046